MTHPVAVIAFDLGGVLVDVDKAPITSLAPPAALDRWLGCHDGFQAGAIGPATFFARGANATGVPAPTLEAAWRRMVRWRDDARPTLDGARASGCQVVFWSNTDPVHASVLGVAPGSGHALSYDVGANKPDVRFTARALALLGVPAHAVRFIDDRAANVTAAQKLGVQAQINLDASDWLRQLALV